MSNSTSLNSSSTPSTLPNPTLMESTTKHPLYLDVVASIQKVYDPELPLNVYDLGLIYQIEINSNNQAKVLMTLTNPACPVAGTLPKEVEEAVLKVHGIQSAKVTLTWTPPWSKERLSLEHQLLFSTFM